MTLDEHLIKNSPKRVFKFRYIMILVCLLPYFIGALFKILHWPGANVLRISGLAFIASYAVCAFLRLKGKSIISNIFVIVALFILAKMLIAQFIDLSFPYNPKASWLFWICFISFFLIFELVFQMRFKQSIFTPQKLFSRD